MAGLLDRFFGSPEQTQALGLLGAALAQGQGAGSFAAPMQYLAGADERRMKQGLLQMQLEQAQMEMEQARRNRAVQQQFEQAARESFITPERATAMSMGPNPDGSNMPFVQPGFDSKGFVQKAYGIDPFRAMEVEQKFKKSPITVAPGASLVDPGTYKELYKSPDKDATPASVREYEFARSQGFGGSFADWELQKRKAGASNVQVKVDNKMGESLAGQVGPMAKDSRIQASGAVQMFDAADRIERALNSNKVIAGPGAAQIQTVRQLAQVLGGGNDEGIRQTRQVIKSLAQMAVEARKQLQGQGQVTENEAKAVAKADAGDINDLTVGELRDLVTLTKRASHYTAKGHNDILKELASNPSTASLVPFYQVQRMDELLKHTPTLPQIGAQPSLDVLLDKYAPRK